MFFILTVLAVIIADTYGKSLASQKGNSTNSTVWIPRYPECNPSFVPEFFKSKSIVETVLICAPGVESTFKSINKKWIENPIWDDGIASEALQEAWKRHSTDADFKYHSTWSWSKAKSNETTLLQKVKSSMRIKPILERGFLATLRAYHKGELEIPAEIPANIYYGCNGIFTDGSVPVITTVCLYREDRKKHWWRPYKNIEV